MDAIISWPLHESNARERLAMLSERGWRVVMIDDDLEKPAKPTRVTSDEADAMRQVVEHLRGLGHTRLAYVGLARHEAWVDHRYQHFVDSTSDVVNAPSLKLRGASYYHHRAIAPFLEAHRDVTAVVAASDHVARQVIVAARALGREVPRELSVVGFGNDVFGQGDLPLTTIDQQPYELGRMAAQLALRSRPTRHRLHQVSTRLIVRGSTSRPS